RGRLVMVANSQPSSEVYVLEPDPQSRQPFQDFKDSFGRPEEWLQASNLRPDVTTDPRYFYVTQTSRQLIQGYSLLQTYPKLMFLKSRGDARVGFGVNIGVYAQGDPGSLI